MADPNPVILTLTERGADLARRIADVIGADVHGRTGRVEASITFQETTAHVRDLFAAGTPVIGICAAGILVRSVAPLLSDKRTEAPIIAVAEDGSSVVPLLGGHNGGNTLARRIAEALDAKAAITTASDVSIGVALDDPPAGWRIADTRGLAQIIQAVVHGAPCQVSGSAAFLAPLLDHPNVSHTDAPDGLASVKTDDGHGVTYHQTRYALGVGCARSCPSEELANLVNTALADHNIAPEALATVCSLDLKSDEAAVLDLAATLGIPDRFFTAADLEAETPRLANPSDVVFAEVGCHGVAEAAALAAAGPVGELVATKRKSTNATCAIAKAPAPIISLPGRARGQVSLIGIGPGQSAWRTPEASRLVVQADELVG